MELLANPFLWAMNITCGLVVLVIGWAARKVVRRLREGLEHSRSKYREKVEKIAVNTVLLQQAIIRNYALLTAFILAVLITYFGIISTAAFSARQEGWQLLALIVASPTLALEFAYLQQNELMKSVVKRRLQLENNEA